MKYKFSLEVSTFFIPQNRYPRPSPTMHFAVHLNRLRPLPPSRSAYSRNSNMAGFFAPLPLELRELVYVEYLEALPDLHPELECNCSLEDRNITLPTGVYSCPPWHRHERQRVRELGARLPKQIGLRPALMRTNKALFADFGQWYFSQPLRFESPYDLSHTLGTLHDEERHWIRHIDIRILFIAMDEHAPEQFASLLQCPNLRTLGLEFTTLVHAVKEPISRPFIPTVFQVHQMQWLEDLQVFRKNQPLHNTWLHACLGLGNITIKDIAPLVRKLERADYSTTEPTYRQLTLLLDPLFG